MSNRYLYLAFFVIAAMINPSALVADELNYGTRIPSTLELIRHFSSDNQDDGRAYRTIVINKGQNDTGGETREHERRKSSVSLQIQFDFDSFELTEQAIQQLHPLGLALESKELSDLEFALEGHTDSLGSEQYNLLLSERRAKAVKRHLLQEFKITSSKLTTRGLGESALLNPDRPDAAENRRVRFTVD